MKKKIIIASIIVILVIAIIVVVISGKSKPEYVTAPAEIGNVVQSVDATGVVSSAEDIELNFKITGLISSIHVKKADKVSAGQILAALDAGALNSRVADARGELLEAGANLKKVLAGSTPEDVKISEITVEQKKQNLNSAQNNLDNLKLQRDTELQNLKNTAIVTFNNELIDAESAMETVDQTLDSADAQETLGILKSGAVDKAEESQVVAETAVAQTKLAVASIIRSSTDAQVLTAINQVMAALDDVRACLSDVFDVLQNTIISSSLSQTELDALISGIQTEQTTISTSKINIQTAESNWTNKIVYYADQITKAEDEAAAAEDSFELAQAQLALKEAQPQDYDITAANARVTKAEASLALAQANLNDTIIRAPVAGTIMEINSKIGESTSLATPVIKMIGESELEIEVDIPESDITKIEVGQSAEITLDSFSDDNLFSGTVTFIDPAETVIQDVVYYQVTVQFSDGQDNIKPGMTANVTIKTKEKSNVLRVPLRSVKQNNGDKIVEMLEGEQIKEHPVTSGLRGDEYYEILDGLSAGEQVITFIKNGK
ncbi:hypothetical protein COZ84_01565 [Candidatus Kuenenbacteria bacterium CG_4_8_14_3_um_filter_39_15]|uniref:Uncharacterized protein n=5 Tax=Candidatus Kueneniibacteriota TaxID=1752740 RepID=A0A2M7ILT5_9BACT|nr:efflux RND transporter periplasmic adaptor subunit [Candidatus Kuenenbacteria bacterium]OIP56262.1 MAG: hypothetical protein AUK13_01475 [Candidatus Kuenenbacteria bacterium CG2_30_39_24]PIP29020.1 MAG: hypothetical protein COX28_01440 [Candidatus Kuenenbacteria bacterium CG23_combo_of_CG06-09_8_20_14_all_39_39]PIW95796.1 MAG: hypothetical protein COZ84_01565 [Candidatus Kuenenbacteria bacterium CG_4_8_14_3_um_filter_39_15]